MTHFWISFTHCFSHTHKEKSRHIPSIVATCSTFKYIIVSTCFNLFSHFSFYSLLSTYYYHHLLLPLLLLILLKQMNVSNAGNDSAQFSRNPAVVCGPVALLNCRDGGSAWRQEATICNSFAPPTTTRQCSPTNTHLFATNTVSSVKSLLLVDSPIASSSSSSPPALCDSTEMNQLSLLLTAIDEAHGAKTVKVNELQQKHPADTSIKFPSSYSAPSVLSGVPIAAMSQLVPGGAASSSSAFLLAPIINQSHNCHNQFQHSTSNGSCDFRPILPRLCDNLHGIPTITNCSAGLLPALQHWPFNRKLAPTSQQQAWSLCEDQSPQAAFCNSNGKFECQVKGCRKTFTRLYNLKSHMRTHTNDRPYKCQQCPFTFSRFHDLKRHMNVHTTKRVYECDGCGKRFSRLDAVNRHRNTACKLTRNTEDIPIQPPLPQLQQQQPHYRLKQFRPLAPLVNHTIG